MSNIKQFDVRHSDHFDIHHLNVKYQTVRPLTFVLFLYSTFVCQTSNFFTSTYDCLTSNSLMFDIRIILTLNIRMSNIKHFDVRHSNVKHKTV